MADSFGATRSRTSIVTGSLGPVQFAKHRRDSGRAHDMKRNQIFKRETTDSLARIRAEFDQWRSSGSGRGRILDRLWRLAVSLLNTFPTLLVCKDLGLGARDLNPRPPARSTRGRSQGT